MRSKRDPNGLNFSWNEANALYLVSGRYCTCSLIMCTRAYAVYVSCTFNVSKSKFSFYSNFVCCQNSHPLKLSPPPPPPPVSLVSRLSQSPEHWRRRVWERGNAPCGVVYSVNQCKSLNLKDIEEPGYAVKKSRMSLVPPAIITQGLCS